MQQLEFFEPSNTDLDFKILRLEASQEKMRRSLFARFNAIQADCQFLYENLELIKDFIEAVRSLQEGHTEQTTRRIQVRESRRHDAAEDMAV